VCEHVHFPFCIVEYLAKINGREFSLLILVANLRTYWLWEGQGAEDSIGAALTGRYPLVGRGSTTNA
jgi:hypothetical protein